MRNPSLAGVLSRIDRVKKSNGGWVAGCPVPDHGRGRGDKNASLSVSEGDDGRVLLKCHAGCSTDAVTSAVGLTPKDLFPESAPLAEIVATYDYKDENGEILFQVARKSPKGFFQRRPDGKGGWINNVGNTRKVLYRLPELLGADPSEPVFVVEGEKDADNLARLGLVATTYPGGAGKWRREYVQFLKGRDVVVLGDNDPPGQKSVQLIARSLHGGARGVKVPALSELPRGGDVTDWLQAGGTKEQLLRLVAETPEWTSQMTLPEIVTNQRPMREVTQEALDALYTRNKPPRLFVQGTQMCRVRYDEKERPLIEALSDHALRGEMERSADFMKVKADGAVTPVPPPMHMVKDAMSLLSWEFPALEGIIQAPALRPDGSVIDKPGYDASTRLFYSPPPGLEVPAIPENPSEEEVQRALDLVMEPIREFPFVDDASFTNALGLMLTSILRPAIDSPVPMALIDAPQRGTGKTLLAQAIGTIVVDQESHMAAPRREEEWQKSILAALMGGSSFIFLDNLTDTLRSPALALTLTANNVSGRILGLTKIALLPQRATWVATANNVELGGDMVRRCYWIRIDAKMATPWRGRTFQHPDLLAWVRRHRGELLGALLTLSRAWFAAGCPKAETPTLGKFESWCETVGGVLSFVGDKNFLGNLDKMQVSLNEGDVQWEEFLRGVQKVHGDAQFLASDLVDDLKSHESLHLPDDLAAAFDLDQEKQASFSRKLGKALSKHQDIRYGDDGIYLTRVKDDSHRGAARWRVYAG